MSKVIQTTSGKTYAVTTQSGCNVYADEAGTQLIKAVEAGQGYFVAIGSRTWVDDDAAIVTETFNGAATAALGGGSTITVDQTFSETSENPQSGKAVKSAFEKKGVTTTIYRAALGLNTSTLDYGAQVGAWSKAGNSSVAVGYGADAKTDYTLAFGRYSVNKDRGTAVMRCRPDGNGLITNFYIIGASSALANTYEGGEACLGYVVKDSEGNILACGTRKLSELLTNNTAFAPTMLDLDSAAPTPFLPTGIMEPDPLVDPEAFENEPEILTDTTQQ